MTSKKRLTRVEPVKAGLVLGALYGILGLIVVPFFLIGAMSGREGSIMGAAFALAFPVLYAIAGAIGGLIVAALYNLVAKWTGGLEVEVTSDEAAL